MSNLLEDYESYLTTEKKASANTVSSYLRDVHQFAQEMEERDVPLDEVLPRDVEDYIRGLTRRGRSAATVTRSVASIKSFYNCLLSRGLVESNPARNVTAAKVERKLPQILTSKEVELSERTAYHNPAVSMSTEDMYRYARQIWTSPARFRNVSSKKHRMTMRLNNIYSAGDYFFLDFSVDNRTNIRFDIDEVRLKLSDKKVSKATNSQVVELKPELVLEQSRSFLHGYRNVIVVKKLTFPNDKVLTVELTEKQISGRTISVNIDYEDVLSADGFSSALLTEE